jgi:hypothetical protein
MTSSEIHTVLKPVFYDYKAASHFTRNNRSAHRSTSKPVNLIGFLTLARLGGLVGSWQAPSNDMDADHPRPDPTHSPGARHHHEISNSRPRPTAKTAETRRPPVARLRLLLNEALDARREAGLRRGFGSRRRVKRRAKGVRDPDRHETMHSKLDTCVHTHYFSPL